MLNLCPMLCNSHAQMRPHLQLFARRPPLPPSEATTRVTDITALIWRCLMDLVPACLVELGSPTLRYRGSHSHRSSELGLHSPLCFSCSHLHQTEPRLLGGRLIDLNWPYLSVPLSSYFQALFYHLRIVLIGRAVAGSVFE